MGGLVEASQTPLSETKTKERMGIERKIAAQILGGKNIWVARTLEGLISMFGVHLARSVFDSVLPFLDGRIAKGPTKEKINM